MLNISGLLFQHAWPCCNASWNRISIYLHPPPPAEGKPVIWEPSRLTLEITQEWIYVTIDIFLRLLYFIYGHRRHHLKWKFDSVSHILTNWLLENRECQTVLKSHGEGYFYNSHILLGRSRKLVIFIPAVLNLPDHTQYGATGKTDSYFDKEDTRQGPRGTPGMGEMSYNQIDHIQNQAISPLKFPLKTKMACNRSFLGL